MGDGLAARLANVKAHLVPIRQALALDLSPGRREQRPDTGLFLGRQREEIRFVPARDDKTVPRAQRKGVQKRRSESVLGEDVTGGEALTEDTSHGHGR